MLNFAHYNFIQLAVYIVTSAAAHFRQFDSISIRIQLHEKCVSSVCLWSIPDWNWHVRIRELHQCDIRDDWTFGD